MNRWSSARRALAAIVFGALVGVAPVGVPDAHALALISGACTTTFTVGFSPAMTAVPGAMASTTTRPNGSSQTDGTRTARARDVRSRTRSAVR